MDEGSVPNPPVVQRPGFMMVPGAKAAEEESSDTQVSKGEPKEDLGLEDKYKGEAEMLATSQFILPHDVLQVLNMRTKTVHLTKGDRSACRSWTCGTED